MNDIIQALAALDGERIPGGCEHCNAYQEPSVDAHGCEVLDLCAAVAIEEKHSWGVWGSRDFSRRPGRKKLAA